MGCLIICIPMRILKTKICTKCKQEKFLKDFYYRKPRKEYAYTCKECNSEICKDYQQGKRNQKDVNFILRARAARIRRDKKKTLIPVADNLGDILLKCWYDQNGLCYYTNEPMNLTGDYGADKNYMVADRKVPELGYVKNNVVLCCNIINRIKSAYSIDEVKEWIAKIKRV